MIYWNLCSLSVALLAFSSPAALLHPAYSRVGLLRAYFSKFCTYSKYFANLYLRLLQSCL